MNPKIRGYMYTIVEFSSVDAGWESFRKLITYDRLEYASSVIEALEKVNYNFTCYGIILTPVWDDITNFRSTLYELESRN